MDQKIHSFFSPNKVLFGIGASGEIGKEAKALGGTKVLIVTDSGVVNSGLVVSLRTNLEEAGLKVLLFDRVEPEPSASLVDESAQLIKQKGVDIVIGVVCPKIASCNRCLPDFDRYARFHLVIVFAIQA